MGLLASKLGDPKEQSYTYSNGLGFKGLVRVNRTRIEKVFPKEQISPGIWASPVDLGVLHCM